MHAQPPRTLKRLLKQYGQELIDDPRRTEALLRDHCGQHTREIFVLVNAQKQRVPSELLSAPTWMPRQATYTRLSRLLQTKLALTEDAANWAVTSWAAALELEALPKGDGWSWLPGQARSATSSTGKKSAGKKRQKSVSTVQSTTKGESASIRKAKQRGARAEMGWALPKVAFPDLRQWTALPLAWSNLLPWVALITVTILLLAVVFWSRNSIRPPGGERLAGAVTTALQSSTPAVSEDTIQAINSTDSAGEDETLSDLNVTPLPELPSPARDYLMEVMPPPIWANVQADAPLFVRQEPSTESAWIGVLQDGTPVSVVAYSDDAQWSQINSPFSGWVNNEFVHFFNEDVPNGYITLDVQPRLTRHYEVDVRAEPDANAAVTTTLSPEELVVVVANLGEPATWVQIVDPVVGWIASNDLATETP